MTLGLPPKSSPSVRIGAHPRWTDWTRVMVWFVVAGGLVGWFPVTAASQAPPRTSALLSDSLARAPQGTRIRVRVLNATTSKGLAKRVTFALRDYGYDVVDFDSDRRGPRTSTLIVSHTAHADWAQRLRRALGTGAIESRPDSLHYVDFTVLVGSDWKPPTQSFRP